MPRSTRLLNAIAGVRGSIVDQKIVNSLSKNTSKNRNVNKKSNKKGRKKNNTAARSPQKYSGKGSISAGTSALNGKPEAVQRFVLGTSHPFSEAAKTAYVPNEHAKPSFKTNAVTRGSISGLSGQTLVVCLHPALTNNYPSVSLLVLDESDFSTIVSGALSGASSSTFLNLDHMYDTGAINSQSSLGVRGCSIAGRFTYTGQSLYRGGDFSMLRLSDYQPIMGTGGAFGPETDTYTWNDIRTFMRGSRLTRVQSLNLTQVVDFALIARPDCKFQGKVVTTTYPMIHSSPEEDDGSSNLVLDGVQIPGSVWAVGMYQFTDSAQTFRYEIIAHMEQKSQQLYQAHTASPAFVQEHAMLHAAIDKAHETHNDNPHKPVGDHVMDTIKSEAMHAGARIGSSLLRTAAKQLPLLLMAAI